MQSSQKPTVAVCVHSPWECEKLLSAGQKLARTLDARLELLHITPPTVPASDFCPTLEAFHAASRQYHAEMTLLFEEEPVFAAAKYFLFHRPIRIVTGLPEKNHRFVHGLKEFLPGVPFSMVSDTHVVYNMFPGGTHHLQVPALRLHT